MLSAMSRIMWKPKMWIGQGALSVELMWAVHTNSVQLKVLKVGAKAHCCTKNTIHTYSYYKYCVAYHIYIYIYMCVCVNKYKYKYIYIYMYLMYVCVCQQQMLKEKLWTLRRVKDSFSFFNAQCSGRRPIGLEASTASLNIGVSFSENVIYPQHQTRKRLNPI